MNKIIKASPPFSSRNFSTETIKLNYNMELQNKGYFDMPTSLYGNPGLTFNNGSSSSSSRSSILKNLAGGAGMSGINALLGMAGSAFQSWLQRKQMQKQYDLQKQMFDYTFQKQNDFNVWMQNHQAEMSKRSLKNAGMSAAGMTDGFTTANSTSNGQLGSFNAGQASNPFAGMDVASTMQAFVAMATARKLNAESEQIESDNQYKQEFSEFKLKAARLGVSQQSADIEITKVQTLLAKEGIARTKAEVEEIGWKMAYLQKQIYQINRLTEPQRDKLLSEYGLNQAQAARLRAEQPYLADLMSAKIYAERSAGDSALMQGKAALENAATNREIGESVKKMNLANTEKINAEKGYQVIMNDIAEGTKDQRIAKENAENEAAELTAGRVSYSKRGLKNMENGNLFDRFSRDVIGLTTELGQGIVAAGLTALIK